MIYSIRKYIRTKTKPFYQNDLIEKLNREHKHLLGMVLAIEEFIKTEKVKLIKKMLKKLKKELELHLLYEDTNLYEHLYLRYKFSPNVREEILNKHNEMKQIAEIAQGFFQKYANLEKKMIEEFNKELQTIKSVLLKRVEFEEEILYELYNKNYSSDIVLAKLKLNQ